jgi:hypothetical protein
MKRFFSYLLILVATLSAPPIPAVAGVVPTGGQVCLSVEGKNFYDCANLVILYCITDTTNNNCTFRESGATAGYQVPANKVLRIVAYTAKATIVAASDIARSGIGYADADVGVSTASALTNAVYIAGGATIASAVLTGSTNSNLQLVPTNFEVPENKYPAASQSSSSTASKIMFHTAYGYLENE